MAIRSGVVAVVLTGLVLLLARPLVVPAQGPDELWEVTTKMEMVGMPMAMPQHTNQVCMRKGGQEESLVPKDKDCKVVDMKRSGNKMSFRMICEGKNKITGTGEIEHTGDRYSGTMRMQGTFDGQPMNMTQTFSGKKVGACTYQDPGQKAKEMMAGAMAAECRRSLDNLSSPMFMTDQAPCKDMRPEFCSRVGGLAQEMREPARFKAQASKRSDWREMLRGCGQDPEAVAKAACGRSIQSRDWNFVAEFCEADAKPLVAQHCEGRDYTTAMSSEHAPLCRRFLVRDAGAPASKPGVPKEKQPAAQTQQPSPTDQLKEGAGKLKGFFKF
jgi:hypothetical protein